MVLLIPMWLSEVEQGYYFTFASLLASQLFFELGMNQVIIQLVSHDFAHLNIKNGIALEGNAICINRLASLVRLLRRWYGIAASLFFFIVSACGVWFFSMKGNLPISAWGGAWLLLTLGTAVNLYLSSALTVLEGCGEIAGVTRMRLLQAMFGSSLMWIALAFGAGLWAMPLVPMVAVVYTTYWLHINGSMLTRFRRHSAVKENNININWQMDIFPFQWRIAVSAFSGFFIFQLYTPLAFARLGAVESGRLGITMSMFSALLTVGMSWVNAKVPTFANYVSLKDRVGLNSIFKSMIKRSMSFTAISLIMVISIVAINSFLNIAVVQRFASIPVIICLSTVTLSNCFIFSAAAYMRAHKEEPMMVPSAVIGLLTLAGAIIGSTYGAIEMMIIYAIITSGVGLPWTYILFHRYWKQY